MEYFLQANRTEVPSFQYSPSSPYSYLEQVHVYLFSTFSPFWVVTFVTYILHEAAYFLVYLPYFIAERIPSLQKYKIQQVINIRIWKLKLVH